MGLKKSPSRILDSMPWTRYRDRAFRQDARRFWRKEHGQAALRIGAPQENYLVCEIGGKLPGTCFYNSDFESGELSEI